MIALWIFIRYRYYRHWYTKIPAPKRKRTFLPFSGISQQINLDKYLVKKNKLNGIMIPLKLITQKNEIKRKTTKNRFFSLVLSIDTAFCELQRIRWLISLLNELMSAWEGDGERKADRVFAEGNKTNIRKVQLNFEWWCDWLHFFLFFSRVLAFKQNQHLELANLKLVLVHDILTAKTLHCFLFTLSVVVVVVVVVVFSSFGSIISSRFICIFIFRSTAQTNLSSHSHIAKREWKKRQTLIILVHRFPCMYGRSWVLVSTCSLASNADAFECDVLQSRRRIRDIFRISNTFNECAALADNWKQLVFFYYFHSFFHFQLCSFLIFFLLREISYFFGMHMQY